MKLHILPNFSEKKTEVRLMTTLESQGMTPIITASITTSATTVIMALRINPRSYLHYYGPWTLWMTALL